MPSRPACIHHLFEAQVRKAGERIALSCGDTHWSYRELDARSNRLAHHLVQLGVGPGALVGVCMERSLEMMACILAILKAGGAYVMLDRTFPPERLEFCLRDTRVSVLLSTTDVAARLPPHEARLVCLDALGDTLARAPETAPASHVTPEDLAYVMYSSGSTGTPKAVEVPHRAIPGFILGVRYVTFDEEQVLLQYSSISWDALTLELWPALLCGGRCVVHPGATPNPSELANAIQRQGITTLWLTSALFNLFIDTMPEALRGVRQLMTGGDKVSVAHVTRALRLLPDTRIVNGYGPSECTVFATCYPVPRDFDARRESLPIGRAIGDRIVHLLDRHLNRVPIGVPGEIYIGGPAVPWGYRSQPELTAQKLVPDPFREEPSARLYRTGDRARYLPDGTIEFLGRVDRQVKIRGFRIEPGEVEAQLLKDPRVRDVAVVVREEAPNDKRLVAYVVPEGPGLSTGALRESLEGALPAFMVPSAFALLPALPLTQNGKVDARALPPPEHGSQEQEEFTGPRSPMEEAITGLFSGMLGVARVGIHDDFFALGGHSLLATRLASRIRSVFGVELPLVKLFELPTPAGLAAWVEEHLERGARPLAPPLLPTSTRESVPASFAQQRLWFLEQLGSLGNTYNVAVNLRLKGTLDRAALGQALDEIFRRHEALRTCFHASGDEPVQRVLPLTTLDLPSWDLSDLSAEERQRELLRMIQQEKSTLFDLSQGPLMRARLLRLGEQEHVLLVSFHHIAFDGWSVGVFSRELRALYAAFRAGKPSPLAALPIQYADFAHWQRGWLRGPALEAMVKHYRAALADLTPLQLPTDFPRPAVETFHGGSRPFRLPVRLTSALEELGRQEGATLFMVLLAGFQTLLHRYTGQPHITVGSPIANRGYSEIENLIGFFVNSLVLSTPFEGTPSFREVLARARSTALGAYANQDLPFEKLVEELQPQRDLSRNPLFQVMFALQEREAMAPRFELEGLESEVLALDEATIRFDLELHVWPSEGGLRGGCLYNEDLFRPETIDRLLSHFQTLLEAAVVAPDEPVSRLPLLSSAERERVLNEWNDTRVRYRRACIHELFEAQAALTPQQTALVFDKAGRESQAFTYQELNARANQVAWHLRRLGVGVEDRVGVCLERSPEMVIALLGILKAGAAYVPLDPAYPAERLRFMISDAHLRMIVTRESLLDALGPTPCRTSCVDRDQAELAREAVTNPGVAIDPRQAAYVLYTSGSTGRPKGVIVHHEGVAAFFRGMDDRLGTEAPGTWLAVTSISFDISVLELFWTLARGFKVVLLPDTREERQPAPAPAKAPRTRSRGMGFSLFYFADNASQRGGDRYRLLLEGARFADTHGFEAVWTPERHFHSFGGLYPNPSLMGAAIAAVTRRVSIRAGSVVLPLHDPLRVAEEWSVVDNLSQGRAGVAFASGWHFNDFVLAPDQYNGRKELMLRHIETVRTLWGGGAISRRNGIGQEIQVRIQPPPVQEQLPMWLTAGGNPETFRLAGELGAHVLTHLLGQNVRELEERISIYREARAQRGLVPEEGRVTVMLHTFVGESAALVSERIREPFKNYLRSFTGLLNPVADQHGHQVDPELMLEQAYRRYVETSALFGTPDSCEELVHRLQALGADELACLIDFGIDSDEVLASLRSLDTLRQRFQRHSGNIAEQVSMSWPLSPGSPRGPLVEDSSPAALIARHQVTHLQSTPSFVRMMLLDQDGRAALGQLQKLLVGGEALSPALARELLGTLKGELHNMYGPTEATVWCTSALVRHTEGPISLGRPTANMRLYVLDGLLQPVPPGAVGEGYIGGVALAHGYLGRPELTAERFIPDPFGGEGGRLYRTGDLLRHLPDGSLEFVGRADHQLKIRGHRIEPGEIEYRLLEHPDVREAAIVARADAFGDPVLTAYVVPSAEFGRSKESSAQARTQVEEWKTLWGAVYEEALSEQRGDPLFNTAGWRSSVDNRPLPEDEMRQWLAERVERVLALRPRRVLELGCGTGMVLFQLAPHCEAYQGVDLSQASLDYVATQIARAGERFRHVTLAQGGADEVSRMAPGSFDAVILNSVIQYFPSVEYLMEILEGALRVVSPGGFVFVGDVRVLSLAPALRASVELTRAGESMTVTALAQRVRKAAFEEKELLIDPALLASLPERGIGASAVTLHPQRGRYANELNRFRINAVLYADGASAPSILKDVEPRSAPDLEALRACLEREQPERAWFHHLSDARTQRDRQAAALLSAAAPPGDVRELRASLEHEPLQGIDPEALHALAKRLSYAVELYWNPEGEGNFDAVFIRQGPGSTAASVPSPPRPAARLRDPIAYANNPLRTRATTELLPELRRFLGERLPSPLIPSAFIALGALPLTPNGKLDRRALPALETMTARASIEHRAPATPTEELVARLYTELLGLDRISAHDHFFEMGGHSLLATRLVTRIRGELGIEVSLQLVFEKPTVAGLSAAIDARTPKAPPPGEAAALLEQLSQMPEEEALALLASTSTP
ncbi:non-ribosomal peptide synthetase [Hyalangium versicolor]|uniref:non-ribosomal peptide synthetase n=1 Tax=Hyalangium versicolor TaxID=2861190 RepID=UPI001CCF6FC3|nr:non-ribosomal peptide synthetase [Hyalangium versicolor]